MKILACLFAAFALMLIGGYFYYDNSWAWINYEVIAVYLAASLFLAAIHYTYLAVVFVEVYPTRFSLLLRCFLFISVIIIALFYLNTQRSGGLSSYYQAYLIAFMSAVYMFIYGCHFTVVYAVLGSTQDKPIIVGIGDELTHISMSRYSNESFLYLSNMFLFITSGLNELASKALCLVILAMLYWVFERNIRRVVEQLKQKHIAAQEAYFEKYPNERNR